MKNEKSSILVLVHLDKNAVVNSYYCTTPVLILSERVSFRYWRVEKIGKGLYLIFWNGGETTLELRSNHKDIDTAIDVSNSEIEESNDIDVSITHVFRNTCLSFIDQMKQVATEDFQEEMEIFENITKSFLADDNIIALSTIPKPYKLGQIEESIFQRYCEECPQMFHIDGYKPKEYIVCVLALLLGHDPYTIHQKFIDENIIIHRKIEPDIPESDKPVQKPLGKRHKKNIESKRR
jgi:hypothetical protein